MHKTTFLMSSFGHECQLIADCQFWRRKANERSSTRFDNVFVSETTITKGYSVVLTGRINADGLRCVATLCQCLLCLQYAIAQFSWRTHVFTCGCSRVHTGIWYALIIIRLLSCWSGLEHYWVRNRTRVQPCSDSSNSMSEYGMCSVAVDSI